MMLTYNAIDAGGRSTCDSIEAPSLREAVEQLRRRGLYVTTINESADRKNRRAATDRVNQKNRSARLPLKTLSHMTRQVAMLLRAGSGIVPAFSAIQRQTTRPGHHALIGRIISDLEDGLPLTEALRKHPRTFDAVYCAIVAAGEASGTLTEMFDRLSVIVGKTRAMRKKILGALAYPCLLSVMCSQIFLVLLFFVIPRFNDMFVQLGVEAPASTKMLLATAAAIRTYWPLMAGAVILVAAGVSWLVTSDHGKAWLSNVQLTIPLLGRLRSRLIQGQLFRTIGTLLESRVNILDALGLVRESTRNRRFQSLFDELEAALQSGGRLSNTFESSGIVEPYICQAVHTGEDTGNLGEAIVFCADMLDETNEELINLIMKLLEPLILIVMGAVVGGVAISLFMPLFDLTAGIR
jgi:type II secretory pathway component PulF